MRSIAVSLMVTLLAPPAIAQSNRPPNWRVRTDAPTTDTIIHQVMAPGWHITSGPPAILFDPANQARGRFAVEAEIFLFPGQSSDGYGVFLGGADLEGPGATWVAFLLTRDGSATVMRRHQSHDLVLFPVTKSAAVKPHPGEGTAHNILRVLVQGDSVVFSANGQRITALDRRDLPLDGAFGFRVGKDVNLHVSNLDLVTRLAPFPIRR
ncbi:MAG: hypothetical protein HUU26_14860 [Gemmatimonadaceae bacterium]|nr:hypothetical protein [Gemmatimonadaceae bacterium]